MYLYFQVNFHFGSIQKTPANLALTGQRKSPRLSAGGAKENQRKSTGLNKTVDAGRKSGGKQALALL